MPLSIPETDRWKAWDNFLEATPDCGFMQSSWWAEFRASVGYESFGVVLKEHGTIVGGAMVMKWSYAPGSCFYYVPDGPVLPEDASFAGEVFDAILEDIDKHRQAEQKTVSHLRIEPRWQRLPDFVRGFRHAAEDVYSEPRDTLYVDLRPPEEAILAQMKPKGRYNIRIAQKHGVSVVEDTSPRGLADFLTIYEATAARKGVDAKPASYFQGLLAMLTRSSQVSIFLAEYRGLRLAGALVLYFGRRATYFFGGSLPLHRSVMAPYLLQFEIMRAVRTRGCDWYDFWGIAPENRLDDAWQHISIFKRKFGGVPRHWVPTLDRIYDPAAYRSYAIASIRSTNATDIADAEVQPALAALFIQTVQPR
jgi:peptidoglycan pentaglycine glycine transferase (the first glycine)